jgi:acetoin utilization deacetylase AcuC-like enzyme
MTNLIPIFYTHKMVADSRSASPSAAKPAKVVASWLEKFPVSVIEPEPVSVEDLWRAHSRRFVSDILSCQIDNGFGNKSPEVAASLQYTSGAMLSAAKHVLETTGSSAAAPCSGFHHAGFETAEGYCTFNGLMVTALALKEYHKNIRVGILDLDMHYGNGTDDIIRVKQTKDWLTHFTGGSKYVDKSQVVDFFNFLPTVLSSMSNCDIVLYQAGADPHINDPYGGWLTTDELRLRDAVVFRAFKAANVPVVWNLAGGYQTEPDGSIPKVLEIHDNTMRECVRVYGGE